MAYQWDSYLETGNHEIDRQHKMLFDTLCCLGNACRVGDGPLELERTLDFLVGYTFKHFADEEKLQRQCGYPDYLRHKRYHDDFCWEVRGLSDLLHQKGYSHELMLTVYGTIGDWLVHHIRGEDFKMAAHMNLWTPYAGTLDQDGKPARETREWANRSA